MNQYNSFLHWPFECHLVTPFKLLNLSIKFNRIRVNYKHKWLYKNHILLWRNGKAQVLTKRWRYWIWLDASRVISSSTKDAGKSYHMIKIALRTKQGMELTSNSLSMTEKDGGIERLKRNITKISLHIWRCMDIRISQLYK
jgi:hypothetical protein